MHVSGSRDRITSDCDLKYQKRHAFCEAQKARRFRHGADLGR
jgi:hypothetical protein